MPCALSWWDCTPMRLVPLPINYVADLKEANMLLNIKNWPSRPCDIHTDLELSRFDDPDAEGEVRTEKKMREVCSFTAAVLHTCVVAGLACLCCHTQPADPLPYFHIARHRTCQAVGQSTTQARLLKQVLHTIKALRRGTAADKRSAKLLVNMWSLQDVEEVRSGPPELCTNIASATWRCQKTACTAGHWPEGALDYFLS